MGIPKFYRWLSERYPLLNMPVTATEAPPEIDNLYLDMNGIIHNCTHANDPNLKLTETEMVIRIFSYLDKLIHIMKPRKLVFMAIDGVAPRAKMNQQRSRRFKTAMERMALEAEKKAKGEETPEEYKFDSNCITPGTGFMARLGRHIRFFVRKKLSEDPVWQQPVVIFSGHDVPGEGEHKIMEYIRWQKRSPSYTPNQRHCMYGLDADLIMLSLVTHEPHFCLLREVVSFTGKTRGQPSREALANPCAENFILFQIGLLREYIELEFASTLASKLPFALDVERVVDDIVLFCMLVGNDFLPALPTLDIAEGALNQLIDTYKLLLPQLGGYLTHAGELNHERLQVLLGAVADRELTTLEERAADTEWFESKRGKRGGRGGGSRPGTGSSSRPATGGSSRGGRSGAPAAAAAGGSQASPLPSFFALEELGDAEGGDIAAAARLAGRGAGGAAAVAAAVAVPDLEGLELEADEPEVGPTMMSKEARHLFLAGGGEEALAAWKERYYKEKLEQPDAGPASTREVVQHYIRGLHWVLQYYYRGVASWDWFYPFHYAPMAQDMRRLDGMDVSFSRGRPFRPFEQLLAVLPSASCSLLPPAFQGLMTDPNSPIVDFYPEKFDIDMEGKRAEWEGVVKVPFIDEARLLAAAASVPPERLTAEERSRNIPGDMLVFEYAAGRHEPEHCASDLPQHFASVAMAHSICRHVPVPEPLPDSERGFVPALSKGTLAGKKNPPGFPTLKTMSNLSVELKLAGVNIFGHPAKKESLVLALPDVRNTIASDAAAPLLRGMLCGRVYVKWPYLQEAEIVAVSDAKQRISVSGIEPHSSEGAAKWLSTAGATKNAFMSKMGIDIGPLPILLDVRVCSGYKRGADGAVAKEYGKELVPYPLQAVLQSRPRPPTGCADPDAPKALSLGPGCRVVWVGAKYFGCVGTVLADPAAKITGNSKMTGYIVRLQPLHRELLAAESRAKHTVQQFNTHFMPSGAASRSLRMNPRLLGRLTGNVWVEDSGSNRVDIGLAVKNAKQGLCVPALCRPAHEGAGWQYSAALVDLVHQYKARFPNIIQALEPSNAPPAAPSDGSLEGGRGGGRDGGRDGGQQRLTLDDLFPGLEPYQQDAKLQEVAAWLKAQPSAKSPLVAMTAQQASDAAVDRLQMQLPGLLPVGTGAMAPVDLEQVHPSLLLPPHDPAAPQSVLAGGSFEPGDRVVVLRGTGSPPFGSRGTVIGVLPNVVEVLMDNDYAGGTTLNGRVRGARGGYLPPEQLLNCRGWAAHFAATSSSSSRAGRRHWRPGRLWPGADDDAAARCV
ncbi:hypothetical protein OEZ86_014473 [Tetradesmus obliquus]|nr:hypothetical protein OEZ86_014473 [Tetradesmus obliquus]